MFDCKRWDTGKPLLVRHVELIIGGICWFVYSNYQHRDDGLQNENRSPMFPLNKREIIHHYTVKMWVWFMYDWDPLKWRLSPPIQYRLPIFIPDHPSVSTLYLCVFSLFYSIVSIYHRQLSHQVKKVLVK